MTKKNKTLIGHILLYVLFFILNIPITIVLGVVFLLGMLYTLAVFIPILLANGLIFLIPYFIARKLAKIPRKTNVILLTSFVAIYLSIIIIVIT